MRPAHRFHATSIARRARIIAATMVCVSPSLAPVDARAKTCIQTYRIDSTDRPNDSQIIFHMLDRTVLSAAVQGHCVGLANDTRGFTYEPDPNGELCDNLWTIRLNTSGAICLMGQFTKVSK